MKELILGTLLIASGIALYVLTPPDCWIAGTGAGLQIGAGGGLLVRRFYIKK